MKRCKICGGTGVVFDRNVQSASPGELRICDCIEKQCGCGGNPPYQVFSEDGTHAWCACRIPRIKLESIKKAFRESEIPKKYMWKFCDDFNVSFDDPAAVRTANKIIGRITTIRDKPSDESWKIGFYLWGQAGSGKTLLASIILQELMLKYAKAGRFVDLSRQFFQRLKRSYDTSDETYGTSGQILETLINIPFLVIDDFGVQRNTEWESEMLYNLIDSRYAEERITVITSNAKINDYKEIAHGRVYSRILEMCRVIHVDLPDYREKFSHFI